MLMLIMSTLVISKKVLGKNLKVGHNFSSLCKKKVNNILAKYSAKVLSYTTSLEKKKKIFIRLKFKLSLERKLYFLLLVKILMLIKH